MTSKLLFRLTASGLALAGTIGCAPLSSGQRVTGLITPVADKTEAGLYAKAQAEVQAGRFAEALPLAEQLVAIAPRDAGYRLLLADLYIKGGRFASAETAFADVLRLDPASTRAALGQALTQIAQGKTDQAQVALDRVAGSASAGDLGLAYALVGRTDRALQLLEAAARGPDADGRVRQNLALTYALTGDWAKARTVAAQDVDPADLGERLASWADLANPAYGDTRVARLLGVVPVAADPGLPTELALRDEAPSAVEIVPSDKPVEVAGYPAPAAPTPVELRLAAAAETLVKADPVVIKTPIKIADAPIPAFAPRKAAAPAHKLGDGRFVVQIGAYQSAALAKDAWGRAVRRFQLDASMKPHSTTVSLRGKGTLHRLSIAGFEAPAEARSLCRSIRAKGGACFVRTRAGDSLAAWAGTGARRG